jgi:hypothetical protein
MLVNWLRITVRLHQVLGNVVLTMPCRLSIFQLIPFDLSLPAKSIYSADSFFSEFE